MFSDQLINVNRKVSIQLKDATLEDALTKLLAGTKVTFEVRNNKIYFIEKKTDQQPGSRKKKVSGVVKDAMGDLSSEPMLLKKEQVPRGDNKSGWGVYAGGSGECILLTVSYIGYLQQDVSTKGKDAV